jgi:hypothetical protein
VAATLVALNCLLGIVSYKIVGVFEREQFVKDYLVSFSGRYLVLV